MSYLLDTDIISLAHKKFLPAKLENWLAKNEADCFISAVTVAEMRYGAEIAPEGQREKLTADVTETETQFAEAIEPVNLDALIEWKRIFAYLKSIKRTLACEDTLIAAQCLAGEYTLSTNNGKHFSLLEPLGLKIVNPLE
jgi:predicted nucleic acid-binding protein